MKAIKILNDLISIDSQTNKSNSDITSYIEEYFSDFEKFSYNLNGIKRYNLIVKVGEGKGEPLIFALHTDTIEIQKGWATNPLIPYQRENKIFGLGASDVKGSLACLIASSLNCKPSRNVYFVFVGSERR